MADELPPVQTETSPAPTAGEAETIVTETAPVSTTPPAAEPSDSTGKAAGGVEGYQEMKARLLAETEEKKRAKAAPAPAVTEATPAAEKIETPAAAATTAEETPVVVDGAPAVTDTPPAEPAATEDDEGKTPDRIRIASLPDGHLVAAATSIARNEGIPFADAFARVSKKPDAAAPSSETTTATGPKLRTRDEVVSDLAKAKTDRRAAAKSQDALEAGASERKVDADERIETLNGELEDIRVDEERKEFERESAEQATFSRTVNESKKTAVKYWPDAGKDGSPFSNRMLELADQYEKDPRLAHYVSEADAPFFFAELVAKEMKMAPAHLQPSKPAIPATTPAKPPTPTATKPAPVTQRAVVRPVQSAASPASGQDRTTQEPPKPDFGVDKIRSVSDYQKVKGAVLNRKA